MRRRVAGPERGVSKTVRAIPTPSPVRKNSTASLLLLFIRLSPCFVIRLCLEQSCDHNRPVSEGAAKRDARPSVLTPLQRAATVRRRERNAESAGLTDESVCPTLMRKRLRACGAGAFACQPIFSQLLRERRPSVATIHEIGVVTTEGDRKSTRLNSSHLGISYAVFC